MASSAELDREIRLHARRIIEQEHRSLAAVLHGMLHVAREIRYMRAEPDFVLLAAMLHYIDSFLEQFHHPKEDVYLFERLRTRAPGTGKLLDRLHGEHVSGYARLLELREALARYQHAGRPEFAGFATLATRYAAFHWSHMTAEETEVLPLAERHLTAADWAAIDDAFLGHTDPLFGVAQKEQYDDLFRRIVNLAPPPIGIGRDS